MKQMKQVMLTALCLTLGAMSWQDSLLAAQPTTISLKKRLVQAVKANPVDEDEIRDVMEAASTRQQKELLSSFHGQTLARIEAAMAGAVADPAHAKGKAAAAQAAITTSRQQQLAAQAARGPKKTAAAAGRPASSGRGGGAGAGAGLPPPPPAWSATQSQAVQVANAALKAAAAKADSQDKDDAVDNARWILSTAVPGISSQAEADQALALAEQCLRDIQGLPARPARGHGAAAGARPGAAKQLATTIANAIARADAALALAAGKVDNQARTNAIADANAAKTAAQRARDQQEADAALQAANDAHKAVAALADAQQPGPQPGGGAGAGAGAGAQPQPGAEMFDIANGVIRIGAVVIAENDANLAVTVGETDGTNDTPGTHHAAIVAELRQLGDITGKDQATKDADAQKLQNIKNAFGWLFNLTLELNALV